MTHAANDLALYAVNTGAFYRDIAQPLIWSLARRKWNGTHDEAKARGAWSRAADTAAEMYRAEFKSGVFTKADRMEAAEQLAAHYAEAISEKVDELNRTRLPNVSRPARLADLSRPPRPELPPACLDDCA